MVIKSWFLQINSGWGICYEKTLNIWIFWRHFKFVYASFISSLTLTSVPVFNVIRTLLIRSKWEFQLRGSRCKYPPGTVLRRWTTIILNISVFAITVLKKEEKNCKNTFAALSHGLIYLPGYLASICGTEDWIVNFLIVTQNTTRNVGSQYNSTIITNISMNIYEYQ